MVFEVPGAHFGYQNGVRNGVQNGISMLKALEGLLTGILEAMIAFSELCRTLLDTKRGDKGLQPANTLPTAWRPEPAGRGWEGDKSLSPGTGGGLDLFCGSSRQPTRPEAQRPRRICVRARC